MIGVAARAPRTAAAFAPLDAQTRAPSLAALLRLKSGEFKRRYARTAIGWRGAAMLRRNLWIYGLGGFIAPFPFIWLIDRILGWLRLA